MQGGQKGFSHLSDAFWDELFGHKRAISGTGLAGVFDEAAKNGLGKKKPDFL